MSERPGGGSIIGFSSIRAVAVEPGQSAYAATKAGMVQILRTENQNIPLGEVNDADRTLLLRSPGQFTDIEEIKNIVVMTRDGVPVYMRDIADVRDGTEDRRSFMRINGVNGIRMQVTKQSGTNTIQIAEGVKKEVARINQEVDGIKLQVLDDQSRFIERAIGSVTEHAFLGGLCEQLAQLVARG